MIIDVIRMHITEVASRKGLGHQPSDISMGIINARKVKSPTGLS